MPSIHTAFPSSYVRAADLGNRRITVTISHLKMEDVGGDGEQKPVLYFKGGTKGLVLNKTNANSVVEVAGTEDYSQWAGVRIALYATKTDFKGKSVDCIRVAEAGSQQSEPDAARPVAHPATPPITDDDPSIPF